MAPKGTILKLSTKLAIILERCMKDQQANEVDHVALNIISCLRKFSTRLNKLKWMIMLSLMKIGLKK
jgi:hypothetical protein